MKVERQEAKPTFEPIVITLETEEEASHLWHRINATSRWGEYCKSRAIPCNNTLDFNMWQALNDVFQPADDC